MKLAMTKEDIDEILVKERIAIYADKSLGKYKEEKDKWVSAYLRDLRWMLEQQAKKREL